MISKNILILISIVIFINIFVEKSNAVVSEKDCHFYVTLAGFTYNTGIENRNYAMNNDIAFPAMHMAISLMETLPIFRSALTKIQKQYYEYVTQPGIDPNLLQKPAVWCCLRYVEEVLIDEIHFKMTNQENRKINQDVLNWQMINQFYTDSNFDEKILTDHANLFQEIHNKYGEVVDKLLKINTIFHNNLPFFDDNEEVNFVDLLGDTTQLHLIQNYWNYLTYGNDNDLQSTIADWSLATVCSLPTSLQPGDSSTNTRRTFEMH